MKKIFPLFFIIALLLCILTGCDDSASSSEEIYKVEIGAVSKDTYNTAMNRIQNLTEVNYNEIYSIRNYLYQNTLSNHEIKNGVSSIDIEELMKFKRLLQLRNFNRNEIPRKKRKRYHFL